MVFMYERVKGRKFTEFIALLPSVQYEVDDRTLAIAERADLLLLAHKSQNVAHIEVEKGDIDSYVVLVDSNVTNDETVKSNSALSIEFGRAGFIDQNGTNYGASEGLFILAEASHLPKKRKKIAKIRRDRNLGGSTGRTKGTG